MEISPAEARQQVETGDAILVDVRAERAIGLRAMRKGLGISARGVIELEIEEQIPDVQNRRWIARLERSRAADFEEVS
jgi:hypothetical protein